MHRFQHKTAPIMLISTAILTHTHLMCTFRLVTCCTFQRTR